ncbi:MAG: hypothetical protein KDA71_07700 [Planctomycetales bacterium]|nr:hypothetical protein [Planctomycetales bacterium]
MLNVPPVPAAEVAGELATQLDALLRAEETVERFERRGDLSIEYRRAVARRDRLGTATDDLGFWACRCGLEPTPPAIWGFEVEALGWRQPDGTRWAKVRGAWRFFVNDAGRWCPAPAPTCDDSLFVID